MSGYLLSLVPLVGVNVVLAVGLNVVVGFCGQISLGQAAFYGLGAYVAGLLALAGLPVLGTLPLAALAAGTAGLAVGLVSLRVREDFLAVTTIAVGFLFLGTIRKSPLFGGEIGLSGIPATGLGPEGLAVLVVALAAAVIALSLYMKASWLGFAFAAVAEDEEAARTIAIPVSSYKLAAFFVGSTMSGLAGALYCAYARFITPDTFGFVVSVSILAMTVIGGLGSTWGAVAGASLLTLLPEMLRFAGEYRQLVFGALIVLVIRFAPGGLAGALADLVARRRKSGAA